MNNLPLDDEFDPNYDIFTSSIKKTPTNKFKKYKHDSEYIP